MTDSAHILVVDDDARLRQLLSRYLSENGYMVSTAADAGEARRQLESMEFDLIVLDVMMPGETGIDAGADDYMGKPFEPRELLLRIGSVLRRSVREAPPERPQARFGRFGFDLERQELAEDGLPVHLTTAEAALLGVLVSRAGETLSREELAELTGALGNLRTVDVQITRLRKKIEDDPRSPRHLQTVRGRGYVLWID
jgi:two-component system phosphate regulon response regulator OmpR